MGGRAGFGQQNNAPAARGDKSANRWQNPDSFVRYSSGCCANMRHRERKALLTIISENVQHEPSSLNAVAHVSEPRKLFLKSNSFPLVITGFLKLLIALHHCSVKKATYFSACYFPFAFHLSY